MLNQHSDFLERAGYARAEEYRSGLRRFRDDYNHRHRGPARAGLNAALILAGVGVFVVIGAAICHALAS